MCESRGGTRGRSRRLHTCATSQLEGTYMWHLQLEGAVETSSRRPRRWGWHSLTTFWLWTSDLWAWERTHFAVQRHGVCGNFLQKTQGTGPHGLPFFPTAAPHLSLRKNRTISFITLLRMVSHLLCLPPQLPPALPHLMFEQLWHSGWLTSNENLPFTSLEPGSLRAKLAGSLWPDSWFTEGCLLTQHHMGRSREILNAPRASYGGTIPFVRALLSQKKFTFIRCLGCEGFSFWIAKGHNFSVCIS